MKLISGLILFLIGSAAYAQPVLNAKCASNIHIRAPKGGAGVYFDRDCSVAYVLPPRAGTLALEAIARTSNLAMCSQIENYMKGLDSISRAWKDLAEQVERGKSSGGRSSTGGGSPLFPRPTQPDPGNGGFDFAQWDKQLADLENKYESVRGKLANYDDIAAATAQFSYTVGHQELVEAYRKLNPSDKFTFQPITLTESRIYLARTVSTDEQRKVYPAVVFSSLPGYGPAKESGEIGQDNGVYSGEAQSSQIGFSLMGICPYYNSASGSIPEKLAQRELSANMVADVRYVYELQVARRYKMTYNLGAMLRRLQRSESRGGFFTTRSVNRLIVERSSKEEFDLLVESEDGRWQYDDQMAQMLKAQLLDRAFKDLDLVSQGIPEVAPSATVPKTNGAEASANELQKCPYVYCQIAAGVLRVANAIWGGSVAVNEYINSVNVSKTETSEERKMLTYRGTVDFKPSR